MSQNFLTRVSSFIRQQQLLLSREHCLVALSGGADSVCLLITLQKLGFVVDAVHCNFHLRGAESDRDEQFCASLCESLNIPFHRVHFETTSFATTHHVSLEMAARSLRYRYFLQLSEAIGTRGVCVAHHRDDSVETMLLNLVHGTGIHGLTGIAPLMTMHFTEEASSSKPAALRVVRPLLCVARSEIEQFLADCSQQYITDSTNLIDDIERNKLRLNVIPELRRIRETVSANLYATALRMSEAVKVYDAAIRQSVETVVEPSENDSCIIINVARLLAQPSAASTLYAFLQPLGFTPSQITQIAHRLNAPTGSIVVGSTHQLLYNRGQLIVEPLPDASVMSHYPLSLPEEGIYVLPGEEKRLTIKRLVRKGNLSVRCGKNIAQLDAAWVKFPLQLRYTVAGDRFQPLGMRGMKLVSDYLTDHHYNLFQKRRQLLLTDATGKILWLLNERPDHRFRITNKTCEILRIEML